MKTLERRDEKFEERSHIWLTIDIKDVPTIILRYLAGYLKDEEALDILADVDDDSVKIQIAFNPCTLTKTLTRMAHSATFHYILELIAVHEHTDQDTIVFLMKHEDEKVRVAAVSNPHAPASELVLHLFDPSLDVVCAAIRNPTTPEENIDVLLTLEGISPLILGEIQDRKNKKTR